MATVDICPGCGEPMTEAGAVPLVCDEKGHPVDFYRLCCRCAEVLSTGTPENRMELFDRVGEVESAFFVCPFVEKEMAVH